MPESCDDRRPLYCRLRCQSLALPPSGRMAYMYFTSSHDAAGLHTAAADTPHLRMPIMGTLREGSATIAGILPSLPHPAALSGRNLTSLLATTSTATTAVLEPPPPTFLPASAHSICAPATCHHRAGPFSSATFLHPEHQCLPGPASLQSTPLQCYWTHLRKTHRS